MYIGKFLVIAAVSAAVIWGCGKQETPEESEFASTRGESKTFRTDASDVFDEFYRDDTSPEQPSEPEPREPTRSASPQKPEFVENGRYVVQLTTVQSNTNAENLSAELNSKGYPAYVVEVNNPAPNLHGTYYRVRIGGFRGISQAQSFGNNFLKPDGYDFWVDNRANDNVGIQGAGFGTSGGSSWGTQQTTASDPEPQPTTTTTEPEPQQYSSWESEPAEEETAQVTPVSQPVAEEQPSDIEESSDEPGDAEDSWDIDDWDTDSEW
ncbi:SPOR domain-containing protein [Chitinispirillales bacterium ANBcel5]|uniref:SPOR domain-containing protein n=1 Tax=Cellulosispirillum alkaliphilum TaxID=3039283 RepID=UPI002A585370|nr:SPOR domain-containing protein [Chitinispirillales bacterium ANBcel5]